ncbi:NAD-binding protein [Phyllobacterium sp. SB3]|uniref:NAD-binding protein n=1 Tax=Phyllobacterium sp. SB3 TaxID=3156073 RepID=UPI0032AFBD9D
MSNGPTCPPKVLISGASVAGLTLAYWLSQFGSDVTVVERASAVRSGGYPIDVRGSAIGVLEKMSLLPQVNAAHIDSRSMTFIDRNGDAVGSIPPCVVMGNEIGRDVELPRGALSELLYGAPDRAGASKTLRS